MKSSHVVLGSPTNGRTYDSSQFRAGDSIWLDASVPRALACLKCVDCGYTVTTQDPWRNSAWD